MKILGTLSVFPVLPAPLTRLNELADNLWWTWSPAAQQLFASVDAEIWEATNHNPTKLLHAVSPDRLAALATDHEFLTAQAATLAEFDAYMHPQSTWFSRTYPERTGEAIAYFSAEFGLHESLPIYSGGLGVLAGDHCKSASDLGLPFVAVGFLYPQGYFTQHIAEDGTQEASYVKIDFADLPARQAFDPNGNEVLISVQLPGRNVFARVWKLQIGRVPMYLLDTDVTLNAPNDRELSARLYGGDMELRVAQEIVLGIGGVRALRALGIHPTVFHMNEGHAAFLSLERVRELVQQHHLSFYQAQQIVSHSGVFTTHTPVPAGNDAFPFEMIDKFFRTYWGEMGLDREGFMNLARWETPWGERFSMTVLALRFALYANGVSALHGEVARDMWAGMWPDLPHEEIPIGHVTNGVHTDTWLAQELEVLYERYLGESNWREEPDLPEPWQRITQIPDAQLWETHTQIKHNAIDFVRSRVAQQRQRYGDAPSQVSAAYEMLNPDALTIGFARRFATYKRATLIFRDLERLQRLLSNPERPVQIVFAGKAHPADEPGKELIKQVHLLAQSAEFSGRIIFIENYDMNVARHLVQGVDVWLNNPRRPNEASGTSGQKAALNGNPNLSILDGWWAEGYDGKNGWAIGEEREYRSNDVQDEADATSLYNLLENEVVPAFYDRNEAGVPTRWVEIMKATIISCAPRFSMSRQVKDYTTQLYLPASDSGQRIQADNGAGARALAAWKERVYQAWPQVRISAERSPIEHASIHQPVELEAKVFLGALSPEEVSVEIVWGRSDGDTLHDLQIIAMKQAGALPGGLLRYTGTLKPEINGRVGYSLRIIPGNEALVLKHELGLVKWA